MFETQFFLLGLIVVGLIIAKAKIVDEQVRSSMTDLILNVFLPCNILISFLNTDSSHIRDLGIMLIISLGTILMSFLLYRVFFFKTGKEQKKVLLYATLIPNASFMGNPLVESIYGITALSYASTYLIPIRIALWSIGLTIFTGGKGNLKKIIFHPCMIATYLGLIVMVTNFSPPALVFRLALTLGSCTTPLSMIVVGCVLGLIKSKNLFTPLTIFFSFMRLILIPLMVMGILSLLRPDPLISGVSVVLSGTPAGVTTAILADRFNADRELATKIVFVSTLLSIVTVPALVWIMG